jgi:alpha-glucosidase
MVSRNFREIPQNYVDLGKANNVNVEVKQFDPHCFLLEFQDKSRWTMDHLLQPLKAKVKETVFQSKLQKLDQEVQFEDQDLILKLSDLGNLSIQYNDDILIQSIGGLKVSSAKWLYEFFYDPELRFYGMGEKNNGFEKSGQYSQFFNTDIFNDFHPEDIRNGITDPMYISIPYLLIYAKGYWIGILLDNAKPAFFNTGSNLDLAPDFVPSSDSYFYFGSTGAPVRFAISCSKKLQTVSRSIQHLMGTTARPPLWSLGHHQSRWSYMDWDAVDEVINEYQEANIPLESVWLDIDYMERYKIFTWNDQNYPAVEEKIQSYKNQGIRIIPILDPGIKVEDGYRVYELGLAEGHFAKTPESIPFTAFIWPGPSHFPDFTQEKTRLWWANYVSQFLEDGIEGVWIDMNEPATASQNLEDLRFQDGKVAHDDFHNQYALGMQMATHQGFLLKDPDKRPFILSRSGCTSSNTFAAQWTGDNVSNFHHLQMNISMLLNLSLSGVSFVGADLGGFAEDCSDELLIRWYAASIFLPFIRNHSALGTSQQEAYQLGKTPRSFVRRFLKLRYQFIPYLYQQFIAQEVHGLAFIRPLFYEYPNEFEKYQYCDDQFLIGDSILLAPVLKESEKSRIFSIPKGNWVSLHNGQWYKKGDYEEEFPLNDTAVFLRNKRIVPIQDKNPSTQVNEINFHIILNEKSDTTKILIYHQDDGESFAYERGNESIFKIQAKVVQEDLVMEVEVINDGYGPLNVRFTSYRELKRVIIKQKHRRKKTLKLRPYAWKPLNKSISVWVTPKWHLGI